MIKEKKAEILTGIILLSLTLNTLCDKLYVNISLYINSLLGRECSISLLKSNVLFGVVIVLTVYTLYLFIKKRVDYTMIMIIAIISSFIISNISILLDSSFTGFDNYWDYGDMTFSSIPEQYYSTIVSYSKAPVYGTNYPPLAIGLMKFLSLFYKTDNSFYAANYITTMMIILSSVLIFYITIRLLESKKEKYLVALAYLLSGPMLFEYQRLNITIIAFILLWLYVLSLDSKDRRKQRLGIVCLILSANIKLFPAIFGLLLVKRKRYKDSVFSFIGGILLFLAPKIMSSIRVSIEGVGNNEASNPKDFVQNVDSFVSSYCGSSVSMQDIVYRICKAIGFDESYIITKIGLSITLGVLILGIVMVIKAKNLFQELLILTMLCIFIPSISYWYSLIYLIIPMTEFLRKKPKEMIDWIQYFTMISLMLCTYRSVIFPIHSFIRLLFLWFLVLLQVFNMNANKYEV